MKFKTISKFGIIFAVTATMVTTAVFTACSSDDDFGGGITGEYTLATRAMTRAGENDGLEEDNKGHVVLCKTISDRIGQYTDYGYVGGEINYKICVFENVVIDNTRDDSVRYTYSADIEYLERQDPNIESTIISFNFDSVEFKASVSVNDRIYYYPYGFDLNNIPHLDFENSLTITVSDE